MPRIELSEHEYIDIEVDCCSVCGPERIHFELRFYGEDERCQATALTPAQIRELIRALEPFASS